MSPLLQDESMAPMLAAPAFEDALALFRELGVISSEVYGNDGNDYPSRFSLNHNYLMAPWSMVR